MLSNIFFTTSSLVGFQASDGLLMKGFFAKSDRNLGTIIHVHGNFGNFYENSFIAVMAETYTRSGFNFLSVNNRGHDGIAEAYRNAEIIYVGGAYETFGEFIYDIQGAVQFAEQFGSKIILQGHSMGCLKVLSYIVDAHQALDFVLLSPSDSFQLQADYISPESVSEQVARIKRDYAHMPSAILSPEEFGIRELDVNYQIPITARTLLTLLESPYLELLRYRNGANYSLDGNLLVYYGGADRLQTESRETVTAFFRKRVKALHFCYYPTGDHQFRSLERQVCDEIISWALANL